MKNYSIVFFNSKWSGASIKEIRMPKLKILIVLICSLFFSCNFLSVDEKAILRDSKSAFQRQRFREEPFLKAESIARYAGFLLRNCDTLFAYRLGEDYKKIQISEGGFAAYKKESGICFTFLTNHQDFMKYYIPEFLIDSIKHYTAEVGEELTPSFTFCPRRDILIKDRRIKLDSIDNVELNLKYVQDEPPNHNYKLRHFIYANKNEKVSNDIQTIYETLQKDTLLINELRYAIQVIPYSGF